MNKVNPALKRIIPLDTKTDECTEIPIEDLPGGKWRALFEWEYDGRDYYFEEEFEIE